MFAARRHLADPERSELIERHVALALWIARRHWARRGGDLGDLRQEACLALVRCSLSYDPARGAFRSFAAVCIRHHLATRAAVHQAERRAVCTVSITGPAGDDMAIPAPAAGGAEPDEIAAIRAALDRLPPTRKAVVLAWAGGQCMRELARDLGLSRERVYQLRASALAAIAEALGCAGPADRLWRRARPHSRRRERGPATLPGGG